MAAIEKSVVTLRISGDTLVPAEITQLLGAAPTAAETKGAEIIGPQTGIRRIAKTGMWRLSADSREPEDMDAQIEELLSHLTPDLKVWHRMAASWDIDLFCGVFMGESNDGLILSPRSLTAPGERHIELQPDIYAPSLDEATPRT
jgi:Domain of unknown function (DUF4279)